MPKFYDDLLVESLLLTQDPQHYIYFLHLRSTNSKRRYGISSLVTISARRFTDTIKIKTKLRYNEIKTKLENNDISDVDKNEINLQLIKLKKQFIRPKKSDINNIKSLIVHSGLQYCEANGEADELCASMILNNQVDACMSDDMDLFVYGCNKIYRYIRH